MPIETLIFTNADETDMAKITFNLKRGEVYKTFRKNFPKLSKVLTPDDIVGDGSHPYAGKAKAMSDE